MTRKDFDLMDADGVVARTSGEGYAAFLDCYGIAFVWRERDGMATNTGVAIDPDALAAVGMAWRDTASNELPSQYVAATA